MNTTLHIDIEVIQKTNEICEIEVSFEQYDKRKTIKHNALFKGDIINLIKRELEVLL